MFVIFSLVFFLSLTKAVTNVSTPIYYIDTTQPPDIAYKQLCADKKDAALDAFTTMFSLIPKALQPEYERIAMHYYNSDAMKEPYKSEIDYFSKCSGIPVEQMITVNLVYDLTAFCTSIIVKTTDGQVIHGRNQDYPTVLREDTVTMVFVDGNNNTLYETTNFVGYVGVPTGEVYNGFSITIDARDSIQDPLFANIIDTIEEYFPSGWLVRECLINDKTFDQCVNRLSKTKIMAGIYYIIAGDNNGAVITRNETNVNGPNLNDFDNIWFLNASNTNQPNHEWYILETNFDYWKVPKDDRRDSAIKMLNSVGQDNINYDTLYNILSTPPVLAPDTLYTAMMSPVNSHFHTDLRYNTTTD